MTSAIDLRVGSRERPLVVIPAFNEAASVADVVLSVRREVAGVDVLVVDDGSSDGTATRAGSSKSR